MSITILKRWSPNLNSLITIYFISLIVNLILKPRVTCHNIALERDEEKEIHCTSDPKIRQTEKGEGEGEGRCNTPVTYLR